MNMPEIVPYEEQAIDTIVSVINRAKELLGERQTLRGLANTRKLLTAGTKVPLTSLHIPLAITTEALIKDAIENKWKLTDTLMYTLNYSGRTQDECSQYFFFECFWTNTCSFLKYWYRICDTPGFATSIGDGDHLPKGEPSETP
ncbi:hypothetical protein evm_002307 [Chilo suppressalis]|nr:hypothetical protein evm_002307 [Chilo suppressalis]